ncbi:hypothetical protein [Conexibacter sp. DBS9H8]|uniref:hypothetical protein n=1 Tax=Conexibacter sp. DBS9H8 TaxID=2937801 RepID=UPI002010866E|nr:hypothetical protein [Conexibacter sp. DBS9H8]
MELRGHGLAITLPAGWEGRISRRGSGPVLHAATFPLLSSDGDFGSAATGRMADGDSFLTLVEYVDPDQIRPGRGLFAASRPRGVAVREFGAMQLQVTRRGQLGWQRFFTESGRTCCLYAVLQPGPVPAAQLVAVLNRVLAALVIS